MCNTLEQRKEWYKNLDGLDALDNCRNATIILNFVLSYKWLQICIVFFHYFVFLKNIYLTLL